MNLLPIPESGGEGAITQTDGRLAWEIAANISPIPDVLKRFGITTSDFKKKLQDPMFRQAVREAKSLWKSELNAAQRIKIKAQMLVEDSLLDIFAIVKNENMTAASKLEAFEKLIKTAEIGQKAAKSDVGGGSAFKINIHLGDSPAQQVTIDGHAITDASAA